MKTVIFHMNRHPRAVCALAGGEVECCDLMPVEAEGCCTLDPRVREDDVATGMTSPRQWTLDLRRCRY